MKKTFCFLFAVLFIFSSLSVAAFAAEKKAVLPIIDMRGFMSSQILEDKDDENSTRLFPPETNALLKLARRLLPSLTRFSFDKNWDVLGDTLIPALQDLLNPVACDVNGDVKGHTGAFFTYPSKQEIAEDPNLSFVFDWREDPFTSAAQLNDFVRYVTDDCGFGKVALECHSYAGIVTLTYLSVYGVERIESVCFNATAVFGAAFAGELMQGKVHVSADGLGAFLQSLIDQSEYEGLLRGLVTIFDDLGGLSFLCDFVNGLFEHLSSRIWKEAIVPVFGSWLSIWSMVPDLQLEAGKAFIEKTGVTQSETFRARIEKFNNCIRKKRAPLLRSINDQRPLYVIARYGYAGVPLGDIWTANSDGVLTTEAESFGATCEQIDFTAPPTIESINLLSPHGAIDASTCLFPTQTWFIRNCSHTEKDPALRTFTDTLLRAKGQQTINSFYEYPQFMVLEKSLGGLFPDDGLVRTPRKWQDDLRRLFRKMIENMIASMKKPFAGLKK